MTEFGRPPLVEVLRLTKRWPGVVALDGVDFSVRAGEVHVLFGENGAGKSTLISILAGVTTPSEGTVLRDGEPVAFASVRDARAAGISAVFQEFSLVPTLTVAENMFLGEEIGVGPFVDRAAQRRRAVELLAQLDFVIDPDAVVVGLSRAEQQMVEIAKSLRSEVSVLILDEPTASLSDRETAHLFSVVEALKARGIGIVYISHRIHEFARIADRITVLRDGRLCATVPAEGVTEEKLLELMAGRAIGEIYPDIPRRPGAVRLAVEGLIAPAVRDVSFAARAGEVLGMAGLVGSGKSELWQAVLGLAPKRAGRVVLADRDVSAGSVADLVEAGLHYLPPDRKEDGLQLAATVEDNLVVGLLAAEEVARPLGLVSIGSARRLARAIADRVELARGHLPRLVSQLSGGNQQKVLFGKGLGHDFDVYVFDEPTVGVDRGTRAQLYRLIDGLVRAGKAVIVVSSDLTEVMNLSHRLLVFADGRITAELEGEAIGEAEVLRHFFVDERTPA